MAPIMNASQRAAQIWPLLAWAATNRQVLTYGTVGDLIGVPTSGLGHLLEPIQSYCLIKKLPPLTVIVVSKETGLPGSGFVAADFATGVQRVHAHNWLEEQSPTPEQLDRAVKELPSKGVDALRPT